MGYTPWGRTEEDGTEQLTLLLLCGNSERRGKPGGCVIFSKFLNPLGLSLFICKMVGKIVLLFRGLNERIQFSIVPGT